MNAQIESEAADWLVEFQTGTPNLRTRERFRCWLRGSPEHVRAYIELAALWEDARLYDSDRTIDIEALIAEAPTESNVISIGKPGPGPRISQSGSDDLPPGAYRVPAVNGRFKWAVAAAFVAATIAGFLAISAYRPLEYATGIGEQRTVRLADGSSVELDGASLIRVHFSAHERRIDLVKGQALFTVAKNPARPFVVVSGGTRVRDVGTQFDIDRDLSDTVVTVLEGRVAVTYPSSSTAALSSALANLHPIQLSAGEQIVVMPHVIPLPQPANLAKATAWTRNELIFDSTPLPEVAVEFNRLNVRQLVIEGPRLQTFHVSGVFPALDPASLPRLLQFLRAQPGIQIVDAGDRIIVSEK